VDPWTSSAGAISIRFDEWPLLRISLLATPTLGEFTALLSQLTTVLKRREPYVTVTESVLTEALPVTMLRLEADWHRERSQDLERYCLGIAMVVLNPSPGRSFAASTVRSMGGKQAAPMQVFGDVPSAVAWARQQFVVGRPR